jgi:hypothetical protein
MVSRILALETKDKGIIVGLISPGWVRTDYGRRGFVRGTISPEDSAAAVSVVIDNFSIEQSGLIFSHEGEQMPW